MSFTEKLAPFFTDFATQATVSGASVSCIYDRAYADAFNVAGSTAPMLTCQTSQVTGVTIGAAVTINSASFTVAERRDNGQGITELYLELA